MRQEFEKLPEIKSILNRSDSVYWSDKHEYYTSLHDNDDYSVGFVNGAMYAYQEQQKKIDGVLRFLNGYDSIDIESSVELRDCVNEIQELLK